LLVASHIVPWRSDPGNRLNPKNGLCLSAIHDRAFDLSMSRFQLKVAGGGQVDVTTPPSG